MPLSSLRRASLDTLLRDHWIAEEDVGTAALIERLREARNRGYLRPSELVAVCRWKSPRSIAHVLRNTPYRVRRVTAAVLGTQDERERFDALLALHGVSVPTASSVLTMLEPDRYGVIDIRVWQLLHAARAVGGNPRGAGFTFEQWRAFLYVIRDLAARHAASPRAIERTLFAAHRFHQQGLLYGRRS